MIFWIIASLLVLLALSFTFIPFLRKQEDQTKSAPEITVYKAQLQEVEISISQGILQGDEALAAKVEIQRRLLKAAGRVDVKETDKNAPKTPLYLYAMSALLVAVGVYYYLKYGTPMMPDFPISVKEEQFSKNANVKKIKNYIVKIKQRIAKGEDVTMGYFALAHFESQLGHTQKTSKAFEKIIELEPDNYQYHLLYAQSMIRMSGGRVPPAALLVLKRAVKMQDKSFGAVYYLALSDFQKGDVRKAYESWKKLAKETGKDDTWAEELASSILKAEVSLRIRKPQKKIPAAPFLTAQQRKVIMSMGIEEQEQMIRSMVQSLAQRMEQSPTVGGLKKLGRAYRVLKEKDKAIEAFSKALKMSEGDEKKEIEKILEKLTIKN